MSHYTDEQKQKCADREYKKRQHVYPRLITAGKMRPEKAEAELEIMREIADDYARRVRKTQEELLAWVTEDDQE